MLTWLCSFDAATDVGLACSQAPNNPLCLDNHSLSGTQFLNFCTESDVNKSCSVPCFIYICLMFETVACCRKLALHTKVTVSPCFFVFLTDGQVLLHLHSDYPRVER